MTDLYSKEVPVIEVDVSTGGARVCRILDRLFNTRPFPETLILDNGTEFPLAFALAVQEAGIRLRHIKPRRPEQNGKVERSHRIDEEEFWSRTTFDGFASATQALRTWEHQYNHDRFSMALQA